MDAREGITTGISAYDRARTLRVLADAASKPDDLTRPGHVLPLRCRDSGSVDDSAYWDIALALVVSAGVTPGAAVCQLMGDDGDVLGGTRAYRFAAAYGLAIVDRRRDELRPGE